METILSYMVLAAGGLLSVPIIALSGIAGVFIGAFAVIFG
jgi:hypothetical protein